MNVGAHTAAMAALIEGLPDAVCLVDADALTVLAANAAAGRLLGVPASELCGRSMIEMSCTPQDLCFWSEVSEGLSEGIVSDTLVQRSDGELLPVTRSVCRVEPPAADGVAEPVFVVSLQDRSAERRTAQETEIVLAGLRATLESTADGILVIDLAGRVGAYNHRFAEIWGLGDELLTRRDDDALREWMRGCVVDPSAYDERLAAIEGETLLQASDVFELHSGRVIERVTLPQCSRGQPIGRVYSFRDITDSVAASQRIDQLSRSDALTGLPNRRELTDRVESALAKSRRDGVRFALLHLNLDHFRHVNDSLGHVFGDRVLIDVSERIKSCLRQGDTVSRLGGDEFVMLLQQADAAGAEATARRVMRALSRPFVLDGLSFTVTCSIGIALHPDDGASTQELMRHADKAMRAVKEAGRSGYRFQQRGAGADLRTLMRIDHAMRQALGAGGFALHYEPQVDLASGRVVGAAAQIRWHDAEMGEMAPADFLPLAEASGFIAAIGEWMLAEAVHQAAQWRARGLRLTVAVKVPALQFQQPDFVGVVARALRESGLPPPALDLELGESVLGQDAQGAQARLEALAALGVRLSIGNFGSGYTSLASLKRLPIHSLKIGRSFVDALAGDESDAAIVRAIVGMGRALHMQVLAEGVNTEAQRQFLQRAGCKLCQGLVFAPALDAPAFEERAASAPAAVHRPIRLVSG